MAISIDVLPNIDPAAFAERVKIGIVIGLLTTASDLLTDDRAKWFIQQAITDLTLTAEADE